MKIAILEVECHAEVLRSTLELFSELPNYRLTIFTTPEILEETGFSSTSFSDFKFILKKQNESEVDFIKMNLSVINANDYLLINTLQRKFHVYNQLPFTLPIYLRVHNVNFYWSSLFHNKKYLSKDYKLIIKEFYESEYKQRRQFLSKVSKLLFPSTKMMEYAFNHFNISKKNAIHFPLNFSQLESCIEGQIDKTTIVIPGKLDEIRKDFGVIKNFIKELSKHSKALNFKIVFLGESNNAKACKLIVQLKNIVGSNIEIVTFNTLIPSKVYSKHFQQADLVICPIKTNTIFQLSKEKYGLTKISGGVNDAIHFGKTCFVPESYIFDHELVGLVDSYANISELVAKVLSLNYSKFALTEDSIYQKEVQKSLIQQLFA